MFQTEARPRPPRIITGKISAKRAAVLSGLRLPVVVDLCRRKIIFGIHEDGKWWVSPACLLELRDLVLLTPSRPLGAPETFAIGGRK